MHQHRTALQHERPASDPASTPTAKRCPACQQTRPAGDFYVSNGRLSTYCKGCQRAASRSAYHRRRQDPELVQVLRDRDRRRKRLERARAAKTDPDRERRNGRVRTAAVRRLIAIYHTEYRALLAEERTRLGGGADASR
jgi:predicted Fe-S protein YdhL (DUF1289 family)